MIFVDHAHLAHALHFLFLYLFSTLRLHWSALHIRAHYVRCFFLFRCSLSTDLVAVIRRLLLMAAILWRKNSTFLFAHRMSVSIEPYKILYITRFWKDFVVQRNGLSQFLSSSLDSSLTFFLLVQKIFCKFPRCFLVCTNSAPNILVCTIDRMFPRKILCVFFRLYLSVLDTEGERVCLCRLSMWYSRSRFISSFSRTEEYILNDENITRFCSL